MNCIRCIQNKWQDPQPVLINKDYCIFHAPVEEKGITVEKFNALVFNRINNFKSPGLKIYLNFSGTIFPGKIHFENCNLNKNIPCKIDFYKVFFTESVNFSKVTFTEHASFYGATFTGGADFSEVTFIEEVDFNTTIFTEKANFKNTTFNKKADFYEATFAENADFSKAKFKEEAHFYKTMFQENANFSEVNFIEQANFYEANFPKWVNFYKAIFTERADFTCAMFTKGANFIEAEFNKIADFYGATFSEEVNFKGIYANENSLYLHNLHKISLGNINFSSIETNMFSFKGCHFPEQLFLYPESLEKPDFKECEELYRSLKQKTLLENNQPLTSKWHYREKLMELRQIQKKKKWSWFLSATAIYYASSGFGERPERAGIILIGILFLLFLGLSVFPIIESHFIFKSPLVVDETLKSLADLTGALPFIKERHPIIELSSGMRLFLNIMQALIYIQGALLLFALRNRFRR